MKSEKSTAYISFRCVIGLLITYFKKKLMSNFVDFHIRQFLGLSFCFFMIGYHIVNFGSWMMPFAFWLSFLVLNIYVMATVICKSMNPLPIIGVFFQNILNKKL